MKIGIIGAGAYGCYAINVLQKKFPNCEITLFDVGLKTTQTEKEIGYKSNSNENNYSGLSKGRFFGYGGTTTRWGGQLLTFTDNDFKNAKGFLKDIISINEKFQKKVYSEYNIDFVANESKVTDDFYLKTGVWLGYFNRDLFKYFKINKRPLVKIITEARIIEIISSDQKNVQKIVYLKKNKKLEASFDFYFLTAGAFESNRLLLKSKLIETNIIGFSDHLSRKAIKIKGKTKIGNVDFSFKVKGTSLITKRLTGEIDQVSYYIHPVFNSNLPLFRNIKSLLFKKEFNLSNLKSIFKDLPSLIKFFYNLIFLKKIYVHKNEWYLYIDIENPNSASSIKLSSEKDKFNQEILDVNFEIGKGTKEIYTSITAKLKEYLRNNKVDFEECDADINIDKLEDTYHPYGMVSDFESVDAYFGRYNNLVVFNTGLLPRAGGINVTAAVFPLIEEYVTYYMG